MMGGAAPLPIELLDLVAAALPRLNRPLRTRLAEELTGLWWGLRTGVLIDSVMLSEREAEALGNGLSSSIFPLFVVYESTSGQTLGVHGALAERFKEGETRCIEVGGNDPVLSTRLPPIARTILRTIASHSSSPSFSPFLRLDPVERPHDLVGPVGCLLDYPMTYCISNQTGQNCLGGVTLQLDELSLANETTGARRHLLAYSFPSDLFKPEPIKPGSVPPPRMHNLTSELSRRLSHSNKLRPQWGLEECGISGRTREVVLDRVAL
ncbi:hypothetical protein JCM11251_002138 [Rhodosporidiobolus azoricus]